MTTTVRRIGLLAVALAVATVGLRLALRGLDWPTFRSQVERLDWRWLAMAVVFDVISYLSQGLRWRFLLDGASIFTTTRAIYAGLFVNELVPLRPGEAVRAWLAARDLKLGVWSVVPAMVAERLMDAVWLAVGLLAALALSPFPPAIAHSVWLLTGGTVAAILAGWHFGANRWAAVEKVKSGLRNPVALLVSSGFLVSQGLAFWAVAHASHLSLGLVSAFIVMMVVRIGTLIPGAPANVGAHQFSTVLGLSLFGVRQAEAAGFSMIVFTVLTVPLLVIGFLACVSAGVTWTDVRRLATKDDEKPLSHQPGLA